MAIQLKKKAVDSNFPSAFCEVGGSAKIRLKIFFSVKTLARPQDVWQPRAAKGSRNRKLLEDQEFFRKKPKKNGKVFESGIQRPKEVPQAVEKQHCNSEKEKTAWTTRCLTDYPADHW